MSDLPAIPGEPNGLAGLAPRERFLRALAMIEVQLLAAPGRASYDAVVRLVGEATGADRAYIQELDFATKPTPRAVLKAEWCTPGTIPQVGQPGFEAFDTQPFYKEWGRRSKNGAPIAVYIDQLPPEHRGRFNADTRAILAFPVTVRSDWVGILAIDNCHESREWTQAEIDFLKSVAHSLVLSVEHELTLSALASGERRLRNLFDAAGDAIVVFTLDGTITDANPAFERIFGYPRADVIGHDVREFVSEESYARHTEVAERLFSGEAVPPYEQGLLSATGEIRWAEVTTRVLFDEHGPAMFQSILRDITARKEAEAELARRAHYLSALAAIERYLLQAADAVAFEHTVRILLDATGTSRVHIHAIEQAPPRQELAVRAEIAREGIPTYHDLQHNRRPVDAHRRWWLDVLAREGVGLISYSDMNAEQRVAADRLSLHTVLMLAITTRDGLWGYIGLDECEAERRWTRTEIDLLRAVATSLSMAIDREQANQLLRRSEAEFEQVFTNSPLPKALFDRDGCIVRVNGAFSTILGYDPGALIGMSLADITHPDDITVCLRLVNQLLAGEIDHFELTKRYVARDGRIVEAETRGSPITNPETGERDLLVGQFIDLTERNRSRRALETSEAYLRALIENSLDAITRHDARGHIVFASPSAATIFGIPHEELPGQIHIEHVAEADRGMLVEALGAVLQGHRAAQPFIYHWQRPDGLWRTLEVTGQPLLVDGEPDGAVFSTRDITERELAREELARRAGLMAALASIERHLVQHPGRAAYPGLLGVLGLATGASRAYIAETADDADGTAGICIVAEWNADSATGDTDDPGAILPAFGPEHNASLRRLMAGEEVAFEGDAIPAGLRRGPAASLLCLPLLVDGAWAGFIGLESGVSADGWAPMEIDLLRAAASSLSVALERERVETSLRESEAQLEEMFANAPVGNMLLTLDGRPVRANRALCNLLGMEESEVLASPLEELVHPGDRHLLAERLAIAAGGATDTVQIELRYRRRDGVIIDALTQLRALPAGARGVPGYLVAQLIDVTRRRRAEEALRISEQQFRGIVEHSQDIILIVDQALHIRFASPSAQRFPAAQGDLTGTSLYQWIAASDHKVMRRYLAGATATTGYRPPVILHLKGGEPGRWAVAECIVVPLPRDGEELHYMVDLRDVTERMEAEARLRASEERFRSIVENSLDIFTITDLDGSIDYVSPNVESILGLPASELIGTSIFRWIDLPAPAGPAEFRERIMRLIAERPAPGGPLVTYRMRHADGGTRVLETVLDLLFDGDQPVGVVFNSRDVTDREEAQRVATRLGRIIDQSTNEVYMVDADTLQVLQVNRGVTESLGMEAASIQMRPLTDVMVAPEPEVIRAAIEAVASGSEVLRVLETVHRRQDGTTYPAEARIQFIPDEWPPVAFIVALDITDRKQAEQALLQAQKLDSLAVMAGGVAHDFNNILQAILGNAQLALMEVDEDSPAREMLEQIAASGQRAAHLARQMLDYAGESSPVIDDTDLRDVVDETLSMIRISVPPSIALHLDFEHDLPPVRGDRMQLIQVAMNLIVNAAEAMGDAPGEITVRVARESCPPGTLRDASPPSEEGGEFVVLEVHDTGPGIDPETRARLFDPFFTTKFTGRGLGLSTVFGIVRAHDAAIRIDSQPGEGAVFRVYFPASEVTMGTADAASSGRRAGLEPGQRVLVVDDEPAVLAICRRVLERMGCEPVVARSGDEALAQPEVADALACALIDLTLPGMPAPQIMARLRDLHPDLHIIMMSGYSEEDARGQLDAQAFDHYLQKPFDIEHLRNALTDPGTDPRRRRVA